MKLPITTIFAFGVLTTAGLAARADVDYPGFPSSSGLTLVGNAIVSGGVLRLTSSNPNRVGAAWSSVQQAVGAGFSTTFTFRITSPSGGGADGLALVIQNWSASAIGGDGCRLGYDPISNSLAVELDTYQSGSCIAGSVNDPDGNHVSVHTSGQGANSATEAASIGRSSAIPNLSDGGTHTVRIDYTPGEMDVYIDDLTQPVVAAPVDLQATLALNGGRAWVGFTAATGSIREGHEVLSWSLTEGAPAGSGRPRTPTITEPQFDGRIVNPQDVHMETAPFFDAAGHAHLCTDWELRTVTPDEVIWHADCVTGVEKVHIHLGDGAFVGSHAGRRDLLADLDYLLRARHRSDSGNPDTEWSLWGVRTFHTGTLTTNFPLTVEDVRAGAQWLNGNGAPVVLPAGGGANPARLVLESGTGLPLFTIAGLDGTSNQIGDPATLSQHVEVRVRLEGGATGLTLGPTTVSFVDEDCELRTIYVPSVSLSAGERALYWASTSGSTYVAQDGQDHADLSTLARGSGQPYVAAQAGYVVDRFATGFLLPVNIAFVPTPGPNPTDIYLYVTELYGSIKMVTRAGQVSDYATGLLNFPPTGDFPGSGEQGLAGLAVDPLNGDLYATVLVDNGSGTHYPRVIRLRSADGGRTASSVTTILNMPGEPQGQSHQISNISFGPDGMLYVHMGDGFDSASAQDLTRYKGKILRITRDGAAPPDNPFFNAADGITATDCVYEYGVRNPFGGGWRLSDQSHYVVENGPSVDRLSKLVRGRNLLWDDTDASMHSFAMYNWDPAHAPVNLVFVQSGVFGGSGFPADKWDHAFVSESGPTYGEGPQELGKRIVEFTISGAGALTAGPTTLVEYAGSGRGSVVGLAAGPDGLYFSDLYKDLDAATPIDRGASIFRVRYAPTHRCCRADVDGDGSVSPADVSAFVQVWYAGATGGPSAAPAGDFDGNGAIQPADVAAFVAAWFGAVEAGGC